jgi:translation initiation factor 1
MRLFAGTPLDRPPKCDRCGQPESDCRCPPMPTPKNMTPTEKQTAKLSIEKRKKGKLVTVIQGLAARESDLPALLSLLKSQCGAGGTLAGDTIEIQGNHVERLRTILGDAGYNVRG